VLAPLFGSQQSVAAEADYLALEHEDKGGPGSRRPTSNATRSKYERAVKIYN
jgi:hypothetical protein